MLLQLQWVRVSEVVGDQMGVHLSRPGVGVSSSSVGSVSDIPLLELVHDLFIQLHDNLPFRLRRINLISKLDKPMKILSFLGVHPVPTVHQRRFYHLELLSRYHTQPGLEILYNIVLQLSVTQPNNSRNHVVVTVRSTA